MSAFGEVISTVLKPVDSVYCNSGDEILNFYLNGGFTPNLFDLEIGEGDSVLITYGSQNEDGLDSQIVETKKSS